MQSVRVLIIAGSSLLLVLILTASSWSQCPEDPVHFDFTPSTGTNYSIVLHDGGSPCGPQPCDEIGVFDGDLCVGASVFRGTWPLAIVAWKDDDMTEQETDGYVPGNQISFRIWRQSEDEEEETVPQFTKGDGTFESGPYSEVSFGPTHFLFTSNTGDNYSLVIEEENTLCELQQCDEIGVFDGELCVGAAVFGGTYPVAIVAWGDDDTSPETDGFATGNAMSFRIWRRDIDFEELTTKHMIIGDGTFGDGPYSTLWLECPCDDDTEAPTFDTCPADTTIDCASSTDPAVTGMPTASDYCDPDPDITYDDGPVVDFAFIRTWTATDASSNSTICEQEITLTDTTDPLITVCPSDIIVDCASTADPSVTGEPVVSDNCDPSPAVTYVDDPVVDDTFVRTWTVTDAYGNSVSCQQQITFEDTTDPVFTFCPNDTTVDCTSSTNPAITGVPEVSDDCDPSPSLIFEDGDLVDWSFVRTWTVTDISGNSNICLQTISIADIEAPVITCPANVAVQCYDDIPTVDIQGISVTDNCDPSPIVVHMGDVSDDGSCPEVITRTYRATDNHGNDNECTQIITVWDTQAPIFDQTCPADQIVQCDAVPVAAALTATDNCDLASIVAFSADTIDGTCEFEYTIYRLWTVTDACGNVASCNQTVTVIDNEAPSFDQPCPQDVVVGCDAVPPRPTLTASDNCDMMAAVVFVEDTIDGTCAFEYTIYRSWTVTDACGNVASCAQTVTVRDTLAPTFDMPCPADTTVECDAVPAKPTMTATDNCDLSPHVVPSETESAGSCADEYVITRTWTATDICGNTTVCTYHITVRDTEAPTFNQPCPGDITVECDAVPAPAMLTASDNCDISPSVDMTQEVTPGGSDNDYVITRTWTAIDDCGNSSSCVQTVTVEDTSPPTITCPEEVEVECSNNAQPSETGMPEVSDNCDSSPTVGYRDQQVGKTITRTWVATDASGNADSCEQTIIALETPPQALDTLYVSADRVCSGEMYCIFWDPVSGAPAYEIRENNGFWEDVGNVAQKCYATLSAATYSYRVRAKNDCGPSDASISRSVIVDGMPVTPDTLYSTTDTFTVGQPYTISWGFSEGSAEYKLYEDGLEIYVGAGTDTTIVSLTAVDHYYRLVICNSCGCSDTSDALLVAAPIPTAVEEIFPGELPSVYALGQNYPNPFNPETRIEFSLPHASYVRIEVYNILGGLVKTLLSDRLPAGHMAITWDGRYEDGQAAASGIYLYKMVAEGYTETRKMILLK